jgi:outer membrane protein OmpA-like peptidoglycan-associated protein
MLGFMQAKHLRGMLLVMCIILGIGQITHAQENPFGAGWTLQPDASNLKFQSVKNETKVEISSFAKFSGNIDRAGSTKISILLDSVDTKIDLRNVRMRFLFFETFQHPEAVITAQLDGAALVDLPTIRRKTIALPYTIALHGVSKSFTTDVVVTLLTDDLVSVATSVPISVAASDFGLMPGIQKLEDAAGVSIIPSATVSFDFLFARNGSDVGPEIVEPVEEVAPASAALETAGDFDLEACIGRFEILSRTKSIYFKVGSARLETKSAPLLDALADIITRCPSLLIEVSGHTDSVGSEASNQRLSERRAVSVSNYLFAKGIKKARIVSVGYGETRPIAPNDTKRNKWLNRRIEFVVVNK